MIILKYLWDNRTTALGYVVIILGILSTQTELFSSKAIQWIVLFNGLVTAVLGHYNNSVIRKEKANAES